MHFYRNNITLVGLGILLAGSILQAEPMEILKNPVLEIKRVLNAINIDGDLTNIEWGQSGGTDYFVEIEPGKTEASTPMYLAAFRVSWISRRFCPR